MTILYIALLTFVAAGIGTLTGFGTSTIMVPILLVTYSLPQTLLLVGIIHWFGDIWKIILFKRGFRWKLVLSFGCAGIIATFLGARIIFTASGELLSRILGGFLVAYVLFLFLKPTFKVPKGMVTAVGGGALSGFCAGIFGIGGAVRSAFLSAFDLDKSVYIATAGAIAFAIDTTRIGTYLSGGVRLRPEILWGLLLFIPVSFIGAYSAKRIVEKIPQAKFRMVIAVFLLLVGIKLLLFAP